MPSKQILFWLGILVIFFVAVFAFTIQEKIIPHDEAAPPQTLGYKRATTTYFWIGEGATPENDFIQNSDSYWDDSWAEHFGGTDNPDCRNGFYPCGFTPKENPFYFALPYGEFNDGAVKQSARNIPWYTSDTLPLLKNTWIEIRYGKTTCYAQWEDVGPGEYDDFDYVFGSAENPLNTFGEQAGLDVSPAVRNCLALGDNEQTYWRFIDASLVPDGPWKVITTISGISWL